MTLADIVLPFLFIYVIRWFNGICGEMDRSCPHPLCTGQDMLGAPGGRGRTKCQPGPKICVRAPVTEDGEGMGVPFSLGRETITGRDSHQEQVTKSETWGRDQEFKKIQNKGLGWAKINEKRKVSALAQQ